MYYRGGKDEILLLKSTTFTIRKKLSLTQTGAGPGIEKRARSCVTRKERRPSKVQK
jgi:hypothetical protein